VEEVEWATWVHVDVFFCISDTGVLKREGEVLDMPALAIRIFDLSIPCLVFDTLMPEARALLDRALEKG